jgi:hypothetical protein
MDLTCVGMQQLLKWIVTIKPYCTEMGIEMFCNFVEESFMKLHFLEPIYGDETKMKSYNSKNLVLEIFNYFSFLYYFYNNLYLLTK